MNKKFSLCSLILVLAILFSGCAMSQKTAESKLQESFFTQLVEANSIDACEELSKQLSKMSHLEVGDMVYKIYMEYLSYGEYSYHHNVDIAKIDAILNNIKLTERQKGVLLEAKGEFENLLELKEYYNAGELPSLSSDYEFDYNSMDLTLNAYAYYNTYSDIKGYNLIVFTDYTYDFFYGSYPNYNKFYYVYLPEYETITSDVWTLTGLYQIGTTVHYGQFESYAPVYFMPNVSDGQNIYNYVNYMQNLSWSNEYLMYAAEERLYEIETGIEPPDYYDTTLKDDEIVIGNDDYQWTPWGESLAFEQGYVNIKDGYLNVRSGPGTEYEIVATLSNGAAVYITDEHNGWMQLTAGDDDDIKGYASAEFISLGEYKETSKSDSKPLSWDVKTFYVEEYLKQSTWNSNDDTNKKWSFDTDGFNTAYVNDNYLGEFYYSDVSSKNNEIGVVWHLPFYEGEPEYPWTVEFVAWLSQYGVSPSGGSNDWKYYDSLMIIEDTKIKIKFSQNLIVELTNANPDGRKYGGI